MDGWRCLSRATRYPLGVPLISVRSLTKRYPGGVTALDGLTVDIDRGIVGLVGSNGAGKSTLLKILLGLIDATSGTATVFDLDVATKGTDIRQFVGYMPEHDCLPPDASATDVVAHLALMSGLPKTAARERTAEVLRHVGLYEERYRAIGGYSTGMKQRVKLAQALVHDPRLLLLDEPTNGLDPAGRDEMLELVHRTGTEFGIAVIVASHLLGEIERVCNFLVAIEGGKLLRAAPLGSFTEQTGFLSVEVGDQVDVNGEGKLEILRSAEVGAAALAERLAAAGLAAASDGRNVVITMSDDRPYDLVRDTVADLGLPLVRMEQRRHRLEDLFRDVPGDGSAPLQAVSAAAPPPAAPPPAAPPPPDDSMWGPPS
jgi:ABC-2 type transport system ATP-binding protein